MLQAGHIHNVGITLMIAHVLLVVPVSSSRPQSCHGKSQSEAASGQVVWLSHQSNTAQDQRVGGIRDLLSLTTK